MNGIVGKKNNGTAVAKCYEITLLPVPHGWRWFESRNIELLSMSYRLPMQAFPYTHCRENINIYLQFTDNPHHPLGIRSLT